MLQKYMLSFIYLFVILIIFSFLSCVILLNQFVEEQIQRNNFNYENTIHWFNFMSPDYSRLRSCSNAICQFTAGDDPLKVKNAKAILFYGSSIDNEFPLPRQPQQLWAILHEESSKNVRYLSNPAFIKHFNITSTMSRYSDLPLTLLYLSSLDELTSQTYLKSIKQKTKPGRASVVFMQSDCSTATRREHFVRELMEYIPIDSYGSCLNNKQQPQGLSGNYLNNLYSEELLNFLSEYKFTLAIENAACEDYITEKFWRPLIVGSVPIYFGSPTIRDWAPNNKSVIYIDEFDNAKALAEFLLELDKNDTEYSTYLEHKFSKGITNERLKNEYLKRAYKSVNSQKINFMHDDFECHVCNVISQLKPGEIRQANIKHFDCPMPPVHPPLMKEHVDDDWTSIMLYGQCEAYVLDQLLRNNAPYKHSDVQISILRRLSDGYDNVDMRCDKI